MKIMKRIGPRTDPCGIPDFTLAKEEYARTLCDLSFKNDLVIKFTHNWSNKKNIVLTIVCGPLSMP